jgi:hypothetical protein
MKRTAILMMVALTTTACTTVQLESNTTALAPSINNIKLEQIYGNFSLFIRTAAPVTPYRASSFLAEARRR